MQITNPAQTRAIIIPEAMEDFFSDQVYQLVNSTCGVVTRSEEDPHTYILDDFEYEEIETLFTSENRGGL